ncbi:nitrate reductase molybdenum cofactor assembly chaperone [Glaciecola sp. XM2]|uniref:nitrate reductase molybdenum cofactor assembly chaperone n=1 Tax=Glaciecola sp. XM2 TaxID=1914931 RepID=UPI001BDDF5D5|nr:nitrate reductase molybdenum cofactor assembly chaperone [Glaciecola sp. XM2]MBT1451309.1 nitrate reductase molybdenum cofactor assembly chaperone [Glaciecola sp. XM2]
MKILSLISRLIDYPSDELYAHAADVSDYIAGNEDLAESDKTALQAFVAQRFGDSLLDWQSDYDGLFERGRSLSLLIYEHIHGESRDRGQAMVDLLEQYKAAGLDIGVRELPDYIPLFLEFVSTQGNENAKGWLQDIGPVLALLTVRLEKRKCNYSSLFQALVNLSEVDIDLDALREQVKEEKRDDTKKALDKVWEEEAVTFGGDATNGGCPTNTSKPSESQRRDQDVPIQFIDAANNIRSEESVRG